MKFKSIASRIIVSIVPTLGFAVLLFLLIIYISVDNSINKQINSAMDSGMTAARLSIENELIRASETARAVQGYVKSADRTILENGECVPYLREMLMTEPKICSVGIWYAPFKFDLEKRYFQYYLYRANETARLDTNYGAKVDYQQSDWFADAIVFKDGDTVWDNIVYDPLTGMDVLTVSIPFADATGEIAGLATTDISLTDIRKIVADIEIGETGRAFLVSGEGGFISWFDDTKRFDAKIQYDKDAGLSSFGQTIMEEKEGDSILKLDGVAYKAFYRVIPETNWIIVLLIDKNEISASVFSAFALTAVIPIIGLLITGLMTYMIVRYLRQVTSKVNSVAALVAAGDLSQHIEITENDEFGMMEANLNKMIRDMKELNALSEQALEAANEASKAKGDFLSKMSHEMRTPMNAIIGMTTIGKSASSIDRKDYAFEKIEDASTHLLGVINDILDISKIESGKLELSHMDFNFEKMLQKVVNVINFRVDEHRQLLTVHIDRNIPSTLYGDDQRLAQVITNLLSNAVKFTPEEGRIRLTAELKAVEQKEESEELYTIQIGVSDTGIGLSPEQQAKLFTSFQQADSSTSRKFGGTGLGLAISKRIVELMDGEIWIESELGKGSAFIFTIKLKRGEADEYDGVLGPNVTWKNVRLLVVDDSSDVLEYFEDLAGAWGVACDIAKSGTEAMALIEENGSYDMYFVDWKMPVMDGIELSRRIREANGGTEISIIIMISGMDVSEIEEEAKQSGVDRFLPKPLFTSNIANLISEYVGGNTARKNADTKDEKTDFSGHRVLLAEDIDINREIIMSLLEPTKLAIDCAENGMVAVEKFEANPNTYDMIFMDIQMPELDGFDATRRIRALEIPYAKTVPIIAMTANVFREDIERCIAAGMDDHIGKPISHAELIEKIEKYVNHTRRSNENG